MNLFQHGDFTLNSGAKSTWKLECDALGNEEWAGIAAMVNAMLRSHGTPFSKVIGVPCGGLKLAEHMQRYMSQLSDVPRTLIVDDVLTTGGSMERLKAEFARHDCHYTIYRGVVLFARGKCPSWINAVFQMPECFWLNKEKP